MILNNFTLTRLMTTKNFYRQTKKKNNQIQREKGTVCVIESLNRQATIYGWIKKKIMMADQREIGRGNKLLKNIDSTR